MGKYEPLADHLRKLGQRRVPMKFEDIEAVLGFPLPPSSRKHRAWWSNNASNNVMTHAWIDAGYQTEDVDLEKRRLIFARQAPVSEPKTRRLEARKPRRHPLFGALKGSVRVAEGYDLTEPADPDWGRRAG